MCPSPTLAAPQILVQATDNGVIYSPLSYSTTLDIIVNKITRPPTVSSQVFYVNENSPVNTFVNVIPSSPRKGEALHFNITSGNTDGAFRVQECSGTVFVDIDILDFERAPYNFFNLSVMVTGEMVANVTAVIYVKGASRVPARSAPWFLRCERHAAHVHASPVHGRRCRWVTSPVHSLVFADVNEVPVLTPVTVSVNENQANNTVWIALCTILAT
jgi:hypothetical protein